MCEHLPCTDTDFWKVLCWTWQLQKPPEVVALLRRACLGGLTPKAQELFALAIQGKVSSTFPRSDRAVVISKVHLIPAVAVLVFQAFLMHIDSEIADQCILSCKDRSLELVSNVLRLTGKKLPNHWPIYMPNCYWYDGMQQPSATPLWLTRIGGL